MQIGNFYRFGLFYKRQTDVETKIKQFWLLSWSLDGVFRPKKKSNVLWLLYLHGCRRVIT